VLDWGISFDRAVAMKGQGLGLMSMKERMTIRALVPTWLRGRQAEDKRGGRRTSNDRTTWMMIDLQIASQLPLVEP
jgi:hypothetical protein